MRRFETSFSRAISKPPYTIRERAGRWTMLSPGGEVNAGSSEAEALAAMDDAHRAYHGPCKFSVYFIGETAQIGKPVKIGYTARLSGRLRQLRAASPYTLHVLASVLAEPPTERAYHELFAGQRLHGEWFTIDAAILAEIERLSSHISSRNGLAVGGKTGGAL